MAKQTHQRPNNDNRIFEAAETGQTVLCACNKRPCEGLCRETHLNRKRADSSCCPAAYLPPKKRRERRFREDD